MWEVITTNDTNTVTSDHISTTSLLTNVEKQQSTSHGEFYVSTTQSELNRSLFPDYTTAGYEFEITSEFESRLTSPQSSTELYTTNTNEISESAENLETSGYSTESLLNNLSDPMTTKSVDYPDITSESPTKFVTEAMTETYTVGVKTSCSSASENASYLTYLGKIFSLYCMCS